MPPDNQDPQVSVGKPCKKVVVGVRHPTLATFVDEHVEPLRILPLVVQALTRTEFIRRATIEPPLSRRAPVHGHHICGEVILRRRRFVGVATDVRLLRRR